MNVSKQERATKPAELVPWVPSQAQRINMLVNQLDYENPRDRRRPKRTVAGEASLVCGFIATAMFIAAGSFALFATGEEFIPFWIVGTAVSCGGTCAGVAFWHQKETEKSPKAARWGLLMNAAVLLASPFVLYICRFGSVSF